MASNRKKVLVEEWTADKWFREFFCNCYLPEEDAENYAVIFSQNGMRSDMLPILDKDFLKEMKIIKVGHIIEIMRAAKLVSSQEQRSGITHTTKSPIPTVQSKVVSLKSVVSTKDSKLRRESEVGGIKRVVSGVKRPVPDEGPTLSVKLPSKMRIPPNLHEEDSPCTVRSAVKERTSAQSVEVSSSTEKRQKKSVFERLGTVSTASSNSAPQSAVQISPPGGILKKSANNKLPVKYGPSELPRSSSPSEARRGPSPARLVLSNRNPRPTVSEPQKFSQATSPFRQRSQSPGPSSSKSANSEPSFHVTMSMKLSNPLVTKVTNGPLNKKQQERRNLSSTFASLNRNNPQSHEKQYYGSMAADQLEMSRDIGADKALKQRLGNKTSSWVRHRY